ncbi:hypothetical protein F2P79_001890 [Pimephales promelas]|nr:hypothetical protein F2P79_001890 [Pimephales promelas]
MAERDFRHPADRTTHGTGEYISGDFGQIFLKGSSYPAGLSEPGARSADARVPLTVQQCFHRTGAAVQCAPGIARLFHQCFSDEGFTCCGTVMTERYY